MADHDLVIYNRALTNQILRAVRETQRRERGAAPRQGRWHKKGKSGGCECTTLWTVGVQGGTAIASSGSFILNFFVSTSGGLVEVNVTVDFDETLGDLITKLEAESDLLDGSSNLIISVAGGPLPSNGFVIENLGSTDPFVSVLNTLPTDSTLNNGVYPVVQRMTVR
jgi:hypothetical protein